ncbi:MAG: nucleotide exchange factor GrpE [Patescibacteria group bacterium]
MIDEEMQEKDNPDSEEKINKLEEEIIELTGEWKRMAADYANLERRVALEKDTLTKYTNVLLLLKLFPVLDSLVKAETAHPDDEGLAAIVRQFKAVLASEGVEIISAAGEDFNPHLHECIDIASGEEDDKIVAVLREGYKIGERVLRPTQVRVSKKQSGGKAGDSEDSL